MASRRIGVLIDSPPTARFHRATIEALGHAADATGQAIELCTIPTDSADLDATVRSCAGLVIGPGSPYRDELAVWRTIAGARERGIPLVGT
jgi:CTP synthase (UTP-ammonia lyase)